MMRVRVYCNKSSTGRSFEAGLTCQGTKIIGTDRIELTEGEALEGLANDLQHLANQALMLRNQRLDAALERDLTGMNHD